MKYCLFIKLEKALRIVKKNGLLPSIGVGMRYISNYFNSLITRPGNILIITDGVGDSAYYRAHNVSEELNYHGIRCEYTISDNPFLLGMSEKYKVFIFHRTAYSGKIKKLISELKKKNKEIIFDSDDLIFDKKYLSSSEYLKEAGECEKKQHAEGKGWEIFSDNYIKVCTAPTSYLAGIMERQGKKAIVVKNKLSDDDLSAAEKVRENIPKIKDEYFRLGYFSGSLSHNQDFATISGALVKILEKYSNIKLYLAGFLGKDSELNKFKERIVNLPFVPRNKYYENIWKVDVNLAPLVQGDPFCESKSEIKFMEAGILGIPTVAVRNQTFSEAIIDGTDGFLAGNEEEWVFKISCLVEDKNLCRKIGKNARKKILSEYTDKNSYSERYYEYLRKIISKSQITNYK